MNKRILVVDESLVTREGYRVQLTSACATVTGAVCHDQIHTLTDAQIRADIALVNLADPSGHWARDDFPGIGAIGEILRRTSRPPLFIGYTTFDKHPGLRWRAHRVGVRVVFNRSELEDGHYKAPLGEVVVALGDRPDTNLIPTRAEVSAREKLGLPRTGDLERLVADAGRLLARESMIGEQAQYQERRAFGEHHAVMARTADGGYSSQKWPSWRQIDRIWAWLAKTTELPAPGQRPPSQSW